MLENYLGVKFVRLESGKAWQPPNEGLFFIFLAEGSGDYSDERLTRQLRQGDVLVLRQNGKLTRFVAKQAGMAFRWFSLQLEQLYPLLDVTELSLIEDVAEEFGSLKPFQASAAQASECQRLIAEIPAAPSLEHRAQVLAIAARILCKEFETARTRRPGFMRAEEHMEKVFQTLSESDFLNLSVSQLASRFGCSRRHLNRLFHQFFGSSIASFRMELRLRRVACLLRNPNLKIITVAEQCGFNHLGHFNACFKHRYGVSPGQWRKRLPVDSAEADNGGQPAQHGARILRRWVGRQDDPPPQPELFPAFNPRQTVPAGSQYSPQQVSLGNPTNR